MAHLFYKMLKNDEEFLYNMIEYNPFAGVATNRIAASYAGPSELRISRVNYKFNIFNDQNKKVMGMVRYRHDWDFRPFFYTLKTWILPSQFWPAILAFEKYIMGYNHEVEKFDQHIFDKNSNRDGSSSITTKRPDIWKEQGRREVLVASLTLRDIEQFVKNQMLQSPLPPDRDDDDDDSTNRGKRQTPKMKFEEAVGGRK